MTQAHLTKLWLWISLAAFAYVVGSVVAIQGGVDVFGAKLFADKEKDGIEVLAYFAVIVGAGLMCLALAVAVLYARRYGRQWHARIPVVLLDGLDTSRWEGRVFQIAVVLVLVLLPLYGIGRSVIVANRGSICEQTDPLRGPIYYPGGHWRLIDLPRAQDQLRLMRGDTPPGQCGHSGVEIGWYTPAAFAGLPALALMLFLVWIFVLVRSTVEPEPTGA